MPLQPAEILGPRCQNTSSIKVSQVRGNYHEQHFPLTLNHLIVSLQFNYRDLQGGESILFLKKDQRRDTLFEMLRMRGESQAERFHIQYPSSPFIIFTGSESECEREREGVTTVGERGIHSSWQLVKLKA